MFTGAFARRITAALRISGQRVDININGNHYYKRVVMENTGKKLHEEVRRRTHGATAARFPSPP